MAAKTYEERRDYVAEYQKMQGKAGRDIGPLPKVVKPKRREQCRLNLKLFCETYFDSVFYLDWSDDHINALNKIQTSIIEGGLFAIAFPRGSGKTAMLVVAAEWALLYGHRSFVVLIGATETKATDMLDSIKSDFETNDLLAEDFPEVCYPILKLERMTQRAKGQLFKGESTRIRIMDNELVLPTIPGSKASGATVKVIGITGSIRGMSVMRPADKKKIRPDFFLLDDPQTDESARSAKQVYDRMRTIKGAIQGMAGPDKTISGFAAVTVIEKEDVADQLLDKKANPKWQGERVGLMRSMPTDLKAWEAYGEIRSNALQAGRGIGEATAHYLANQAILDAGAVPSWPQRYEEGEASATQHAMNLRLDDELAFSAEYQNQPLSVLADTPLILTADQVAQKIAYGLQRNVVPSYSTKLTSFIDVQDKVLFYCVLATGADFKSHVVDYGTYPEQAKTYFFLRETSPTMQTLNPTLPLEAQIRFGLEKLSANLLNRDYEKDDGGSIKISRLFIDAGYVSEVIKQFIRESIYKALMIPTFGWGVTADRKPLNEYRTEPGERSGWNWRIEKEGHGRYDTNSWKTFVAQRLYLAMGDTGSLTLFNQTPNQHKMFFDHITSEFPISTIGMGRTVNVWKRRPNRENHYLDTLVGAFVGASEQGITAGGHQPQTGIVKKVRQKMKIQF